VVEEEVEEELGESEGVDDLQYSVIFITTNSPTHYPIVKHVIGLCSCQLLGVKLPFLNSRPTTLAILCGDVVTVYMCSGHVYHYAPALLRYAWYCHAVTVLVTGSVLTGSRCSSWLLHPRVSLPVLLVMPTVVCSPTSCSWLLSMSLVTSISATANSV